MIHDVLVSDLHLGAPNSLLSNVGDTGVEPGVPSRTLAAFGDALRALLSAEDQPPPRLVLGGDIFELALTPTPTAFDTFADFVGVLFDDPFVSPDLCYVAGNHDHHLWELARQFQYAEYVAALDPDVPLRSDWHVTHLFPEHDELPHGDAMITSVATRRCPDAGLSVRHSYPNLGLAGSDATVVFHHGHYTESVYRAVEWLDEVFLPTRPDAEAAWHIEGDNYAWVDFMWSTLGRSGDAGGDVGALYEMLQSEEAVEAVADRLIDLGVVRGRPSTRRRLAAWLLRVGARLAIGEGLRLERHRPGAPLSDDAERGLHEYLRVAVASQLAEEIPHAADRPLTFVFGHTHKPFARRVRVEGVDRPVDVFNTGGWVIDTPDPSPNQGAALVLVDEGGHVASIEVYRQVPGHAVTVSALSAEGTAFAAELERRIDAHREVWTALSRTIESETIARRAQLRGRIAADVGRVRGIAPRSQQVVP